MVRVKDIAAIMEGHFPVDLAETWDNVGLQVGSYEGSAERIMVSLDLNQQVLQKAIDERINLIVTHHPLLFQAMKCIDLDRAPGNIISELIRHNISVYSAHTNLDAGDRGLNQILAEKIGLKDIEILDRNKKETYYKLVVFVPVTHAEAVREAINGAGAGFTGKYSDCSFRTRGTGTFLPHEETHPFIGTPGQLEQVEEYRLETIVAAKDVGQVLTRMKAAHPYEEPAYDLYPLANEVRVFSLGRKGRLEPTMSLEQFALEIKKCLHLDCVRVTGELNRIIERVAVVSGSGASYIKLAKAQGLDLLVTGDLKYHEARDAESMGIAVIDAGHQGTEAIMVPFIKELLEQECKRKGFDTAVMMGESDLCIKTLK